MEEVKLRTLSVLVDNESGVLSQISRLFSRKGFNIESLAVGTTDDPAVSRMTIEVLTNDNQTALICNQLAKMVPVHSVKLLVASHSIRRELVLYKVHARTSEDKNEIIQIANIFRGSIIDVSKETLTLSVIGDEKKTDDEAHYFKSKPYKDKPTKDRGIKDRNYKDMSLSPRDRRELLFEPEDEEEAEIINRHLGKWGDRTVYVRSEKSSDSRPPRSGSPRSGRSDSYQQRERSSNREERQEARREFFSGQGSKKSQDGRGPRKDYSDSRDDRRPRRDGWKPDGKSPRWEDGNRPSQGKKDNRK